MGGPNIRSRSGHPGLAHTSLQPVGVGGSSVTREDPARPAFLDIADVGLRHGREHRCRRGPAGAVPIRARADRDVGWGYALATQRVALRLGRGPLALPLLGPRVVRAHVPELPSGSRTEKRLPPHTTSYLLSGGGGGGGGLRERSGLGVKPLVSTPSLFGGGGGGGESVVWPCLPPKGCPKIRSE